MLIQYRASDMEAESGPQTNRGKGGRPECVRTCNTRLCVAGLKFTDDLSRVALGGDIKLPAGQAEPQSSIAFLVSHRGQLHSLPSRANDGGRWRVSRILLGEESCPH